MLKEEFLQTATGYHPDRASVMKLWLEIKDRYQEKGRYYHTLSHLERMYRELLPARGMISEWGVMMFALFYHDVIYNAFRTDNEEQSARLAEQRLTWLSVSVEEIKKVKAVIRATKSHSPGGNADIALFVDADLAVLGSEWPAYRQYADQIRKEFSVFPDIVYRAGRRKVLTNFLQRERIFSTDAFYDKFEMQARENLQREKESL